MNKITLKCVDYIVPSVIILLLVYVFPMISSTVDFHKADTMKFINYISIEKGDILSGSGFQLVTSTRESFLTIKADFYSKSICTRDSDGLKFYGGIGGPFVSEALNIALQKTDGVQVVHTYIEPMDYPIGTCETTVTIYIHGPFGMRKQIVPDLVSSFTVYE